jgi:hypothetical protein
MALFKPLRDKLVEQRRLNWVSSVRKDTVDGPVYHVEMKEQPGTEKVSWIEKATQRDFSIGVSLAGLALFALTTITPAFPASIASLIVMTGAIGGGLSDYFRNDHEMKKGVEITKPTRFNRDMIRSALGFGFMAKLGLTLVMAALAASGIAIPGMENIVTAWAGGSGFFGQLAAISNAIPNVIGWGVLGVGAAYGAVKGSEIGYARMQREYIAAKVKYERPELGVSVTPESSLTPEVALANVVAPALFPVALMGDVTAGIAAGADQRSAVQERKSWHPKEDQPLGFNFLKGSQAAKDNIVPIARLSENAMGATGFVEAEKIRRGETPAMQAQTYAQSEGRPLSFAGRLEVQRQADAMGAGLPQVGG